MSFHTIKKCLIHVDGYRQLYDDVGNSSVDSVLKDYKKYWKYRIDRKLYTC